MNLQIDPGVMQLVLLLSGVAYVMTTKKRQKAITGFLWDCFKWLRSHD